MVDRQNDYTERLRQALRRAGMDPDAATAANWLCDKLGVSYQAARKAINGTTKMLQADNNVKAARALAVCSEWLATGDGLPDDTDWPFPRVNRARWDACNEADRAEIQGAINQALRECEARREAAEMPQITGRGMLLLPAGPTTGQPDD